MLDTAIGLLTKTSNEEQLMGLAFLAQNADEVKKIIDEPERGEEKQKLAEALNADFLESLFLSDMPTLDASRIAISILHHTNAKCSPSVLETHAEYLLAENEYEDAEEVISLLCKWNIKLTNEALVHRICFYAVPFQRENIRFSIMHLPVIQKHLLKEEGRENKAHKAWLGRALADLLEEIGRAVTFDDKKPLLEALPALLGDVPTRGSALAMCTMLARNLNGLVKHELGVPVLMSALRFAHVEIQMHLETTTDERAKDLCAFMSGCLFTEAVITELDEDLEVDIEIVGKILSALHRIMVVAFDFWIQESEVISIPKDSVGIPLARVISAWTNGDTERYSTEFTQIVPKVLQVAPEEMMPALAAVHARDSAPNWLTKASLESILNFLLTDGASFPRQVACRLVAEIAMDPYVELHDIIPPRDKLLYDKRGQAEAPIPRPLPCQVLSCPTCYVINAWAGALEKKMKDHEEDDDLTIAFEVVVYCLKANCGNLLELPDLDIDVWAPHEIEDELGYLFRAAVRAMAIAGKGAVFKLPKRDEEWCIGDHDAAELVTARGATVEATMKGTSAAVPTPLKGTNADSKRKEREKNVIASLVEMD